MQSPYFQQHTAGRQHESCHEVSTLSELHQKSKNVNSTVKYDTDNRNLIEKFLLKNGFPPEIETEPYGTMIQTYLTASFELHLKTPIVLSETEQLLHQTLDVNSLLQETNPKIGVIFPNRDKDDPLRQVIGLLNVIKVNTLKSKLFVQSERRGRFYGWIDIDNQRLCSHEHVIQDIFGLSDHIQEIDECDMTSSIVMIDNFIEIPKNIDQRTTDYYNFNLSIDFVTNYCQNTNHFFNFIGIVGFRKASFVCQDFSDDNMYHHCFKPKHNNNNSEESDDAEIAANQHLTNKKDLLLQLKNYFPLSQYHDDSQWFRMKNEFNEKSLQSNNVVRLKKKKDIEYLILDMYKNASYSYQRDFEDLHIDGMPYNTTKVIMSVDNNTSDNTFQFSIKGDNCKQTKPLKLKDNYQYMVFMAFPQCTCLFQRGSLIKVRLF